MTLIPSSSSKRDGLDQERDLCILGYRKMTALIWLFSSFSVKYTWPEAGLRRLEISPSTHRVSKLASRRRLIFSFNAVTVNISFITVTSFRATIRYSTP
jgi:hypothetical protein